jgi:hypothetical protein
VIFLGDGLWVNDKKERAHRIKKKNTYNAPPQQISDTKIKLNITYEHST